MKSFFLKMLFVMVLLTAVFPVLANEELYWSNINSDPVKNHPSHYKVVTIKEDEAPVLVQRIRTYHWNSGNGAVPGTISVFEGNTKLGSWQAVGRSAYGTANVYWDALVDIIFYPGHSYIVKVSDLASMSYNEGSDNCGMFEVYGIQPAPGGYVPAESSSSISLENPIPAPVSQNSNAAPSSPAMIPVNTFTFGRYEQDQNASNGPEPIEWQVLTVLGDRQLVVSRYLLDYRYFSDGAGNVKWDTSAVRRWLNDDFYNSAFTAAEKNSIMLITNNNPSNERYGTSGCSATTDRIFLLSIDETNRYFSSNGNRVTKPTSHAGTHYASPNVNDPAAWLLRSPGAADGASAYVGGDGAVSYEGFDNVVNGVPVTYAVRPAFWMKTATGFRVKYNGNNCLYEVPTDDHIYQPGDKVEVLFSPVTYIPGLIFNGWDMNGDGSADYGYFYYNFTMPNHDVELKAICYVPSYDNYVTEPDPNPVPNPRPNQRPQEPIDYPNYGPDRSDYIPPDVDYEPSPNNPVYPDPVYNNNYFIVDPDYSAPDGNWFINGVG